MERIDTLVIDKTGTLTEGRPRLADVVALGAFDPVSVLGAAASLERASEHPLASAVVAGAIARPPPPGAATQFRSHTGKGVTGLVDGRPVAVGNQALFNGLGIPAADLPARAEALRRDGHTVMLVALDGRPAGLVAVSDPIKANAAAALAALRAD